MIQLSSEQLLEITMAVAALTLATVGLVFGLVIHAVGYRRGAGWALGWVLAAVALAFGACIVHFPAYEALFSLCATIAAVSSSFAHAFAAYRFARRGSVPRPVQAVLAGCTVLALLIWWRLATSSPLVAPEFCIMLSTLCNAAALYPLSRDRRRGGVRTAFAISCLLSLMMARTLVYAAVLIFTSRVLSPLYWSFEMAGGVLFAFVLAMGEIVAVLDEVHLEVVETNRSLEEAMVGLETAAKVDSLTGLENRYAFYKLLASFGPMSAADGSIAVLDLNNLKKINDTFGHHAGDLALLSVARCLKEIVRASDYVFRWGGDEFVILLRGTTVETARERLTRMPTPEPLDLQSSQQPIELAVSWGVAPLSENVDAALRSADAQLYRQKNLVKSIARESARL